METNNKTNVTNGAINISDDVIATIASVAVSETEGVFGISTTFTEEIVSKFSKKTAKKGIKVNSNDSEIQLDISVIMQYGVRIPEIAWKLQENVKKSIESMSGIEVVKVNIHVSGINFENEVQSVSND